ncbi:WD40-repeat-containing domain protein [Thamnidium elegans]|nr:WD40-repeat-containing domain protein [Thamnidium elegans]
MIQLDSVLLSEKEDCPISIACHPKLPLLAVGINSTAEKIEKGENMNCRIFNTDSEHLRLKYAISTSTCKVVDEYQKVTRFSQSGNYLVTAFSDGKISVLNTKDWSLAFSPVRLQNVQDADFDINEKHVAIATSGALFILAVAGGEVVQVIDNPKLNRNTFCEIRACRYGINKQGIQTLYAVVNPRTRGRGFICAWKLRSKGVQYPVTKVKTAGVSRKTITSFALDSTGDIIAYASTDLSIGLIDAQRLKPLLKLGKVNDFAITSLIFNRTGNLLASAGADHCCRVTIVPNLRKQRESIAVTTIFMFIDMLLFALLMDTIVKMVDQGTL